MPTRTEALNSLRIAYDRSQGDIPLSEDTAKALSLKARVLSKEDALDLLDRESGSADPEAGDEPDPAPARKSKPSRRPKPEEPAASDEPVDHDPLG